jgi:DNA-binding SARP family transcriptional activator/predicted ATPase
MDARIYLLGRFEVLAGDPGELSTTDEPSERGRRVVVDRSWSRRKAAALLKLLALQPARALHRDQVMEALWPDLDPAAAVNNLHKNLHHLRTAFAAHGLPAAVVSLAGDLLTLAPDTWVDCHAFRAQAAAACAGDDPARYEAALALYRGPLLPEDLYEDWTAQAREELQTQWIALLAEAAVLYEARGEPERAIERWRRLLDAEPPHEPAHRALIRLYARTGSRHRALRQYQLCQDVLRRELGVEPEEATQQVYRAIVAGTAPIPEPARSRDAAAAFGAQAAAPARARAALPPFFGRQRELEVAEELLESALGGQGQALFITGVAGIGKSRFAQQVLAAAEEQGALTLTGRSYALEAASYQPAREMLRQLSQLAQQSPIGGSRNEAPPRGSATGLNQAAQQAMVGRTSYLRRLLPELAPATADPTAAHEPPAPQQLPAADPALLQAELFEEIGTLFAALATESRPLVLYFDDLHDADDGSLRLMHVLCRRLAERPALIVATYRAETADRPDALVALLASLRRERRCQEITLEPLPEDAMRLVVEQLFGGPVARDLVQEIARRAEGNPLFAGELVHTAIEQGWARVVDGSWQRRGGEQAPVPGAGVVQDLLDQRLRRLGGPALDVLHLVAAAGREVSYGLLRRAAEASEGDLLDALDDCLAAFVLEETPRGYRYHHDLLRSAVYGRLSQARRQRAHRTLAAALETEGAAGAEHAADGGAEEIAHHYAESDEPWRAVPYLHQAGRRAAAVFANDQAARLYERAIGIARSHLSRIAPRTMATLLEELGDLRQRAGEVGQGAALFEEACLLLSGADDESEMVRVRGKAALAQIAAGDVEHAAALLQATLDAITEQSPELVIARTYYILAQLHWHSAQYGEALAAAEKAFQAAVASGDTAQRARAYEVLALACHSLGDWQKGVECELNRQALGVGGFDTDEAFDAHL